MDKEKIKHHLASLKERHRELDKKINEGYSHYIADEGLNKIKFEKVLIKREIAEIEQRLESL